MEQDTSHSIVETADHSDLVQGAFNLSGSVGDLLSLQNGSGSVLGSGATPEAASNHLSQGDLEALASIQEELDKFGTPSSQNNFVEGIVNPITSSDQIPVDEGSSSLGLNLGILGSGVSGQDTSISDSLVATSLVGNLKPQEVKPPQPTVRVVKRPAPASTAPGQIYSKVRIGDTGQQFRIVSGQSLNNFITIGGQQLKIVNTGAGAAGVGGNLKTIVPSESPVTGQNISIVNRDGSLTTIPSQQGIKIASSSSMLQPGVVKVANKPQQIRILPNQPQTFKILNADGSFSDISSSFIRPKSDLKTITSAVDSSPKKKLSTYTLSKSPQKMQLIKPDSGSQIIKTADGRIITLQGSSKKVIIPNSGNITSSPTKIVFKDAQGKTMNGSIVMRDPQENVGIKPPDQMTAVEDNTNLNNVSTFQKQIISGGQPVAGSQLIRLTPEVASSLATNSDNKVQFVRVVSGGGRLVTSNPGVQTLQIKGGQTFVNNVQGIRSVVPGNCKVEVEEEVKPEVKPQIVETYVKEKTRVVTNIEPQGVRPRKPCNCTKSQCLKLYCDCFANGEFCFNCNCNGCLNNLQNEEERQRAIKQCLDRNPNAFKPKIGKNTSEGERRHNKGCNCKRSGCLKNYCECYEAKIPCSQYCKCQGCKNVDLETGAKVMCSPLKVGGPGPGGGAEVGGPATPSLSINDRWFKPSTSLKSKLLQANTPLDTNDKGASKQPFSFVTQEVVEATCQCLLAQAEEGEKNCNTELDTEKRILEEFGRCLAQIIEFSGKTKKSSSVV